MSALASQGALQRVSQIFVGEFPVRKSFCGRNVVFKNEREVLIKKNKEKYSGSNKTGRQMALNCKFIVIIFCTMCLKLLSICKRICGWLYQNTERYLKSC